MKHLLALLLLLTSTTASFACSVESWTDEQYFAEATYVFRALVVRVDKRDVVEVFRTVDGKMELKSTILEARYKLQEVLKGSPPASGIVSLRLPQLCGISLHQLEAGHEYVFLRGNDGRVSPVGGSFEYDNNREHDRTRLTSLRAISQEFDRELQAEIARRASLSPQQRAAENRKASPSKAVQDRRDAADKQAQEAAVQKALPTVRAVEKSPAVQGFAIFDTVLVTQDEAMMLYFYDKTAPGKVVRKIAIVTKDGKMLGGPVDRNEAPFVRVPRGEEIPQRDGRTPRNLAGVFRRPLIDSVAAC